MSHITLESNDGGVMVVGTYARLCTTPLTDGVIERAVVERSMLLKNMIDDLGEQSVMEQNVPIANVSLAMVSITLPTRLLMRAQSGKRSRPQEGPRVVRTPQERSPGEPRRRQRCPQEDDGH